MMTCRRYPGLDCVRGLALVSMILYHAIWDLVNLFHVPWPWFQGTAAFVWQQSICWTFIFLSGFCVSFGHRTIRRGGQLLLVSALVSAVTFLFVPESPFSLVC